MIEVGLITATLSGVLKFVTWIQSESRGQDEKTRTALNAIHDAALETRSYQRVWKTKRDINKEIELSKRGLESRQLLQNLIRNGLRSQR